MTEEQSKISARNKLTQYLESKKLRKTPERYLILDAVLNMNTHFGIEFLYKELSKESCRVSRATVYNTMLLFVDCGLAQRLQFEGQQALYEVSESFGNHQHLICTECGKIKEVNDPEFMAYMNARKFSSFTTSYFQLYVYGICNSCARKMKRNGKEKVVKKKK